MAPGAARCGRAASARASVESYWCLRPCALQALEADRALHAPGDGEFAHPAGACVQVRYRQVAVPGLARWAWGPRGKPCGQGISLGSATRARNEALPLSSFSVLTPLRRGSACSAWWAPRQCWRPLRSLHTRHRPTRPARARVVPTPGRRQPSSTTTGSSLCFGALGFRSRANSASASGRASTRPRRPNRPGCAWLACSTRRPGHQGER